ncbi:hypothetical protein AXX12_09295 [Anaerosporomusa subterranea]|jgi:hypothetical protein|uniref:Uncharacterized protein n=1 Tax=Anaerosporomusa subterranea TaxID=1794912 RepID=A0A154BRF8_ANASB|nr:hypothetical protein [Anaerosporomusa subterranea]KYZ76613.1 hypothetical protein AXX12_09295 [Anaerosporomusa subterranea]MDF2501663.1 hypothetical protein [Anaerosporomusa subterranea]
MQVRTGLEIVRLHQEYREKISELELCTAKVEGHGYAQKVLDEQINHLRKLLQSLEGTRFQALEPVNITTSMLGGVSDIFSQ